MRIHAIIRPCLGALLALASASACDGEPATVLDVPSEASALRGGAIVESTVMAAARSDVSTRIEADSMQQLATHDASDGSLPNVPAASYAAPQCEPGYTQRGISLCIGPLRVATNYGTAAARCRESNAYMCTYDDLTYLYLNSTADSNYNPMSRWIGNVVGNNLVLCGDRNITSNNDADIYDFDGTCTRTTGSRRYWCCHDRIVSP